MLVTSIGATVMTCHQHVLKRSLKFFKHGFTILRAARALWTPTERKSRNKLWNLSPPHFWLYRCTCEH